MGLLPLEVLRSADEQDSTDDHSQRHSDGDDRQDTCRRIAQTWYTVQLNTKGAIGSGRRFIYLFVILTKTFIRSCLQKKINKRKCLRGADMACDASAYLLPIILYVRVYAVVNTIT